MTTCVDCDDSGESDTPGALRMWRRSEDEVYWLGGPREILLCEAHWRTRDNAEPPEPDGEAFRGNEAAAYQDERMVRAQRLK